MNVDCPDRAKHEEKRKTVEAIGSLSVVNDDHVRVYPPLIWKYKTSKILESRPWPFGVTWRHRSRDQWIDQLRLSANSITPTLRQSPGQVNDKVANLSRIHIMKVRVTNHVADFHDLCSWQVRDFVVNCPGFYRGLVTDFVANISTCQDGLCPRLSWFVSATFTETVWFHDLSPFVSATFIICVHDFPRGEV